MSSAIREMQASPEWGPVFDALAPAVEAIIKAGTNWVDVDASLVALHRAGWRVEEADAAELADAERRVRARRKGPRPPRSMA